MSYTIDLVRLPPGADPEAAYREQSKEKEQELLKTRGVDPAPVDPKKEQAKQQLARALVTRHPSLRIAQPDFAARNIELNEERYSIQIALFDDTAGASFSFTGAFDECKTAMRLLWDCLEILRSLGGFSAFDPQVGKVLNLDSDFDTVVKTACGRRA
jgi:hypothetical protein